MESKDMFKLEKKNYIYLNYNFDLENSGFWGKC